jgi:hypothetical protein
VVWRNNFGLKYPVSGAGLGSGAVPEPTTMLLFAMALPAYCKRQTRRS